MGARRAMLLGTTLGTTLVHHYPGTTLLHRTAVPTTADTARPLNDDAGATDTCTFNSFGDALGEPLGSRIP